MAQGGAGRCASLIYHNHCWRDLSMPKHLDLLPRCRQDLIYNWVLFQMYTCKLAARLDFEEGSGLPAQRVILGHSNVRVRAHPREIWIFSAMWDAGTSDRAERRIPREIQGAHNEICFQAGGEACCRALVKHTHGVVSSSGLKLFKKNSRLQCESLHTFYSFMFRVCLHTFLTRDHLDSKASSPRNQSSNQPWLFVWKDAGLGTQLTTITCKYKSFCYDVMCVSQKLYILHAGGEDFTETFIKIYRTLSLGWKIQNKQKQL